MKTIRHALFHGIALAALTLSPALADTGTYCNTATDEFVSYYCGPIQPNGFPARDANQCTARVKGTCSSIPGRIGVFDNDAYGQLNPDVAAAGVDRLYHWLNGGRYEGRASAFSFNIRDYMSGSGYNGDLAAAFGTNWSAGLDHYKNYGLHEGRQTTAAGAENAPGIPVAAYNPNTRQPFPEDGQLKGAIMRVTELDQWPDNQLTLSTQMDTSDFTGLPNAWRTGPGKIKAPGGQNVVDGEVGFYGIQQYAGQIGIGIDTRAVHDQLSQWGRWAKTNIGVDAGLGTVTLHKFWQSNSVQPLRPGHAFAQFPWANGANGSARQHYYLRVPKAGGSGPAGTTNGSQIGSYFYIRDNTPAAQGGGGTIALSAGIFETRAGSFDQTEPNMLGGNGYFQIVGVPVTDAMANGGWITIAPGSAKSTTQTWNEQRQFDFKFTRANMQKIIDLARTNPNFSGLTANVDNYEVTAFVFNPETFSGTDVNGNYVGDGWIGLSGTFLEVGPQPN